jgi:hypothetical protein
MVRASRSSEPIDLPHGEICSKNDDMANYTQSRVLSIRLTPELLEAVREQARIDGRSVSGEVVSIVQEQLAARRRAQVKPRRITGWLAHLEVPETHAEFQAGRATASVKLMQGIRARASKSLK